MAVCWQRDMATKFAALYYSNHCRIFSVAAVFIAIPNFQDRFFNTLVNSILTGPHSDYYRVTGGGLTVFETVSIFDIGPATHSESCPPTLGETTKFHCDNQPIIIISSF